MAGHIPPLVPAATHYETKKTTLRVPGVCASQNKRVLAQTVPKYHTNKVFND